jgi:hypothetical protein
MDSRTIVRSLDDAVLETSAIGEYVQSRTPMTDPEVKSLYGSSRNHVNKTLYARGYTAYKYKPSSKGGEFFTRSFYHPEGHRVEVRFDGDEVVRKATGTHGPKEGVENWLQRGAHKPHYEDGYYHGFSGKSPEKDRKGTFQQAYDKGYQVGQKRKQSLSSDED